MKARWLMVAGFIAAAGAQLSAWDLKDFGSFESQWDDESTDENITPATHIKNAVDTPHEGAEDWYLELPEDSTLRYWNTRSFTCTSEEMIFGWYIRFDSPFGDMEPDPTIRLLGAGASKDNWHWYVTYDDDKNFMLRDSNDSWCETESAPFLEDTWYLIEARWKKHDTTGYVVLRINGVEIFNSTNIDTYYGSGTTCVAMSQGQQGIATTPITLLLNSYYVLDDTSGDDDFLGPFYLRQYQTDLATATSDQGTDLSAGQWDDIAETPPASPSATMPADSWGLKRTNGTARAGPNGDTYIGDGALIGAYWIAQGSSGSSYIVYGKYDGASYTYTTDGQSVGGLGTKVKVVIDGDSSYCPDADDWFVLGISTPVGSTGTWREGRAALLYQLPAGFVTLINSAILPRALIGRR